MRSSQVLLISIITAVLLVGATVGVAAQSEASSRPPIPSAGCGTSEVESGRQSGTTEVGESELPWELLVPSAHDGVTPTPLVISLHGGGESGFTGVMRFISGYEEGGFAVVAPEHPWYGAWMYRYEDTEIDYTLANPDTAAIDTLIDDLAERLCVDLARVYATGFSGGAIGTAVLGCALEDRIAALAPVAASLDLGDACALERPVPQIAIHGTADDAALFEGGLSQGLLDDILPSGDRWRDTPFVQADLWRVMGRSVTERVAGVAARNGCEPELTSESITDGVERLTWTCPGGAEVELVVVDGGPHSWPTLPKVDASEMIWDFFAKHSLPE